MEHGSSCKSCRLSDVKDKLWTLYSRRAWVCCVTSATNLNAVKSKIHATRTEEYGDLLKRDHPWITSSILWMSTVAWDLTHTLIKSGAPIDNGKHTLDLFEPF